jgi:hypothetical protein
VVQFVVVLYNNIYISYGKNPSKAAGMLEVAGRTG